MSYSTHEHAAMQQAIALSALGLGTTSPNPPVGCVILDRHGHTAGAGHHVRKGEPHAEVHALAAAGTRAEGGTAAVTLEPCNHHGRTPPCHQALIDAGIHRVLIAVVDPTSRGEGGIARLQQAGLDVHVGFHADEAMHVLRPWLHAQQSGRPWTIAAYRATPHGTSTLAIDELNALIPMCGVDAVLDSGRIYEGQPQGHNPNVFHLDNTHPNDTPDRVTESLHANGVRTLLVHDATAANRYLKHELIDEIYLVTPHQPASFTPPNSLLPHGFHIEHIHRTPKDVVIRATRTRT